MLSTHYLLDPFSDDIVGARALNANSAGQTTSTGFHIVRVRGDAPLDATPEDISDLQSKKEAALRAAHPTYSNCFFNSLADPTLAFEAADSDKVVLGQHILGIEDNGFFTTATQVLTSAPSQALIIFDGYEIITTDETSGVYVQTYSEIVDSDMSSYIQCYVSFDGSVPTTPVTINTPFSIGVPGSDFRVKFENISGLPMRRYVGSYALLY